MEVWKIWSFIPPRKIVFPSGVVLGKYDSSREGGGRINPYISVTIVLKMYNMYVNFSVQSANIKKKIACYKFNKKEWRCENAYFIQCMYVRVDMCRKWCISTLSTLYARQEEKIRVKGLFYGCILFENLAQCTNHACIQSFW